MATLLELGFDFSEENSQTPGELPVQQSIMPEVNFDQYYGSQGMIVTTNQGEATYVLGPENDC
jgi:hypothetical protein